MKYYYRLLNANQISRKLLSTWYLIILILSLLALLTAGCGPEIITIDTRTDNIDAGELIELPGVYIASVKDARGGDPFLLGHITGQVSHNKSSIYLADSLSVLAQNYFNDLLVNHLQTRPVDVVINSFTLVENYSKKDEYHLTGSLSYNYADTDGRQTSFTSNISSNFSRDKSTLAERINSCLRESLNEFARSGSTQAAGNDTLKQSHAGSTNRENIVFDEPMEVPHIEPVNKHLGAGIAYYTGSNITGGMQIEFRMSWQKPEWEYGFSVGFLYVNFIRQPYEGYLWALNLPWNMKYMLSDFSVSPYLGATVKLIAGQDRESGTNSPGYYGNYEDVNSMFWGPTFEESLGLAFDRSVFIEAGVYEMFLFNTNILPNDLGFRLSLHFTVTQ